ncbi:MAG: hypothetical protein Q4C12_04885 [Clostridia bacterium]|nr:hypothetical protein [Clostridia bacterium]
MPESKKTKMHREVVEAFNSGMSKEEISSKLKMQEREVYRVLLTYELVEDPLYEKIVYAKMLGMRYYEILDLLNISEMTLYNHSPYKAKDPSLMPHRRPFSDFYSLEGVRCGSENYCY